MKTHDNCLPKLKANAIGNCVYPIRWRSQEKNRTVEK